MLDQKCPCQKRAHAVAIEEIRHTGVGLTRRLLQRVNILHRCQPAAGKIPRRLAHGAAVPHMVLRHDPNALGAEGLGKLVIPGGVLCDAVHKLDNGPGFALALPAIRLDLPPLLAG